jgi:hypothetical protein
MNRFKSSQGVGALYRDGDLVGRADYEMTINQYDDGTQLAFGWMRVSARVVSLINESVGSFTLELEKSGKVELTIGQINGDTVNFDISGPIPEF